MKKTLFVLLLFLVPAIYLQEAMAEKTSHKDFANMPIKDCNECHKEQGIVLTHDNDWAGKHHQDNDWLGEHRTLAGKAGKNCADCHNQSFCLQCHVGGGIDVDLSTKNYERNYVPKSHRSDWLELHAIKMLDDSRRCTSCHEPQYCTNCHSRFPKGSLKIKSHMMLGSNGQKYSPAFNEHPLEARRNLTSCQSCHPDGDVCIQCHASGKTNPHPRGWNSIKNGFKNRAGDKVCRKCHTPGTY